ncbi:hypothetical protein GQ44DRAFT_799334 [Phaeosphaeriaceae sp. PMI808]|nr:hypothetical protein GQ44DRAFT_799334 [Phaeosphaeriaceae sp. PMI808]
MAKSARASSKKVNRTMLRSRVFGPADKARAERIHAKLLETIQQSKPEKAQMDTTEDLTTTDAAKEDDFPKGSSLLTASIPRCLSNSFASKPDPSTEDNHEMGRLCFYLGLCSDIVGFDEEGDLKLAFDPLPPHWLNMDVDGTAAKASLKKSSTREKSQSRKQLRRKPQNKMTFPTSRGKGALKPFTGGKVNKRR